MDAGSAFALPTAELRARAHELVDELLDAWKSLGDEPAWRAVPPEVRARLRSSLPRSGLGLADALHEFRRDVFPYRYGNIHPRFWGWVNGSGLPVGVLADLLASAMNSNAGAFDQSAVHVEEQVLGWMREMLDFPRDGDGILTSGGSMGNLLALAAALHAQAPFDVRRAGLAAAGKRFAVYGSSETHGSVPKALALLGLGLESYRALPVDGDYRLRIDELERALREDRARGIQPFALVANAGTVNTGATDPLAALVSIARREHLWLHVDGAFGALAWLCPEERAALDGLQGVDSIAFDLHKWMFLPSDVGCLLVRHPKGLERAFSFTAPYLSSLRGGLSALTEGAFKDRGIELTRRFRALKVWLALKVHGLEPFERAIRENLAQARRLVELVSREPRLELLAPAPLNVVCFRYREPDLAPALEELNRELVVRLQEGGVAVVSQTILQGRFALRAAITNHRTRLADIDLLVQEVLRLGEALGREARASRPPTWLSSKAPS